MLEKRINWKRFRKLRFISVVKPPAEADGGDIPFSYKVLVKDTATVNRRALSYLLAKIQDAASQTA